MNVLADSLQKIMTVFGLAVVVSACSTIGDTMDAVNFLQEPDNVDPPEKLVDIDETLTIEKIWASSTSSPSERSPPEGSGAFGGASRRTRSDVVGW